MKRFLSLALAAVLTVSIVYQAWATGFTTAQPDTGTEWRGRGSDGEQVTVPVGQFHLSVFIADVTIPVTRYITIPLTNLRISRIVGALEGQIATAQENIAFFHFDSVGNIAGEVTNGVSRMNFGSELITGASKTFTPNTTSANNYFTRDHVIAIGSLGSSIGNVGASFVITLIPR